MLGLQSICQMSLKEREVWLNIDFLHNSKRLPFLILSIIIIIIIIIDTV